MAVPDETWATGDLIPADWPTEIARGVASKADLNLAGTGTYTLSATEYQKRFHALSGILTGNRNVVTPGDGGRWWWVYNGTSGAFTVTYKTSGGTGVVIPQGGRLMVLDDGTNVVALVFSGTAYTITNVTPDRSYDANSTTLDEVADTLGTLISDLRALGLIA